MTDKEYEDIKKRYGLPQEYWDAMEERSCDDDKKSLLHRIFRF